MSEAGEFQIIEQFFTYPSFGAWKSQGVGDDCAIIDTGAGRLAVTCDMTALGTHFFPDADPEDVGYKALAVNLSDLAAAGAVPRAFFLSIGLPRRDDGWLADFSRGLMALHMNRAARCLGEIRHGRQRLTADMLLQRSALRRWATCRPEWG